MVEDFIFSEQLVKARKILDAVKQSAYFKHVNETG
jgi:hypothetical protein